MGRSYLVKGLFVALIMRVTWVSAALQWQAAVVRVLYHVSPAFRGHLNYSVYVHGLWYLLRSNLCFLHYDCDQRLTALENSSYVNEDMLQKYLEDYPDLLAGYQAIANEQDAMGPAHIFHGERHIG